MKKFRSPLLIFASILTSFLLFFAPIYPAQASYVSDAALTSEIKAKFVAEKGLDSLDLKVETSNGIVTLRGQVQKKSQMKLAEKIARETKGTRDVKNKISVMP